MSESTGPRIKTVIRPAWVVPGSYRQEGLEAAIDLLPLARGADREVATECLGRLLDAFGTWRENLSYARSRQDDLKALDLFIQSEGDPEHLGTLDPVLMMRLRLHARPGSLRRGREDVAEILRAASLLEERIRKEEARGGRVDLAGRKFAHHIYDLWRSFTDRGTSRHNRDGQDGGPFPDFLEASGQLVDPCFKGRSLARLVHDERHAGVQPSSR